MFKRVGDREDQNFVNKDFDILADTTSKKCWGFALLMVLFGLSIPHLFGAVLRTFTRMTSTYVPGTHSMAFITVPNIEVGKKLAHGLVKSKLAACVNIIPGVTSIYEWEGKVEEDPEMIMMVKTSTEKVDDVSKFIRDNHPYDVAEVISAKIENGNEPYLKWLGEEVADKKPAEKKAKTDE